MECRWKPRWTCLRSNLRKGPSEARLSAFGSNFGSMFINLKDFGDRLDPEMSSEAIANRMRTAFAKEVFEAQAQVFGQHVAARQVAFVQPRDAAKAEAQALRMRRLRHLIDQPDLMVGATEELLRFFSVNETLTRTVTADTELGGQQLCRGDHLMLSWLSAKCVHVRSS